MSQTEIVSFLPGIFYAQPSPDAPPYVKVGSTVQAGQVVGLVEVMKQFSEIVAEAAGTIIRITVANGDMVEPGQVLMVLGPPAA